MKKVCHEKRFNMEFVQHEKGATCKEFNMENQNMKEYNMKKVQHRKNAMQLE